MEEPRRDGNEAPLFDPTRSAFPLFVVAAAMVLFTVTINRWVSLSGLAIVGWVGGWEWNPPATAPLTWLVSKPFSVLPVAWQPLALNLFSALLASLTLGLLARCVLLLPHDRTKEQRQTQQTEDALLSFPGAWMAALLAVAVAGLQLTFWEHATSFTGEMLDLFVFALCVWSLLEYRLDPRGGRLMFMAFIYGLGCANNVAMIAFFPGFVGATVWIAGRRLLENLLVVKLIFCGAAGLLLYLVQPLMGVLGDSPFTFWQILKTNLGAQKNILRYFPKYIPMLTGLTSVVPVVLIGIRWSSSVGDISYLAQVAAGWMFRIVHAALLAACLIVAFDPKFSPRELGLGFAFLPYYFLGALAAGYFAGYFLTIGQMPTHVRRHLTTGERLGRFTIVWLTRAATVVVLAALAVRNYPVIQAANGPLLRETAANIIAAAPTSGGLLLGDGAHAALLGAVEAHVQATGATDKFIPVRTDLLRWPGYLKALEKRSGGRWPSDSSSLESGQLMRDTALQELMLRAALSNSITYVHPSFGYYFERFRAEPHGPVWLLTPFEANAPVRSLLATNVMTYNRGYWRDVAPSLSPIAQHRARGNPTLRLLANYYSLLLNTWAVELQRNDRASEAKQLFVVAAQLNPENISAIINRKFNDSLLSGTIASVEFDKPLELLLSKFGNNWDAVLGLCGPIDEPASAFNLAQTLARGGNFRQSAALLDRIVELQPNLPGPRFMLTDALLQAGLHENALGAAAQIRERFRPLTHAQEAELVRVEAWSFFRRLDFATAESLLEGAAKSYPELDGPLEALSQIHLLAGHFTNAIEALDRQLQRAPNNARALLNRSAIAIQIGQFSNAIQSLDHLLTLSPSNPPALLNRAIANLKTTNLDAAERDYQSLKVVMPKLPSVYFGLGEVAFQRNQKDVATGHYLEYLKLASTNSDERALVIERLSQLQKP